MTKQLPTVLLVNSDEEFISITKAALESSLYEVVTATSGKEGLDKAKGQRPDLIVLDKVTAEPGGAGLFGTLKDDRELKDVPVLMISDPADELDGDAYVVHEGMTLEPDDAISSSVSTDEFLRRVERLLK